MNITPINRKSFTGIETLFATILIGIIMAAFFAAFTVSFSYFRRVIELRTATLTLQEEMSLIREMEFDDIESLGSTFSASGMSSLKDADGKIFKTDFEGHDEILKLTLELNWTAFDRKPMVKRLVTLITDHGIDKK